MLFSAWLGSGRHAVFMALHACRCTQSNMTTITIYIYTVVLEEGNIRPNVFHEVTIYNVYVTAIKLLYCDIWHAWPCSLKA